MGANLTELSYSSEELERIVTLRRKNNVMVRLKYIVSYFSALLNERLRNNSFNYRIGHQIYKSLCIICNGVPAPTPFLRHPPLDPACPFLKPWFLLPSFLFHLLLMYFKQLPQPHATPSCPNRTHQPLHIFKQISKGLCHFLSKINF